MAIDNHIDTEAPVKRIPLEHKEPSSNGVHPDGAQAENMARAEEIVDHLAERLGYYAGVLGKKLLWLGGACARRPRTSGPRRRASATGNRSQRTTSDHSVTRSGLARFPSRFS